MTTDIPQSTIDELRRLSAAATKGPWLNDYHPEGSCAAKVYREAIIGPHPERYPVVVRPHQSFRGSGRKNREAEIIDAQLIAAMRNNIDALLTALESTQANERRYLHIRDRVYGISRTGGVILDIRPQEESLGTGEICDREIDAAIAATEVEHGN